MPTRITINRRCARLETLALMLALALTGTTDYLWAKAGACGYTNLWVPNDGSNSVTVVRVSYGAVMAALTGNGLSGPVEAAFDGERIGGTDTTTSYGQTVSLWTATDWWPCGSVEVSADFDCGLGVRSDGLNFWITLRLTGKLARL